METIVKLIKDEDGREYPNKYWHYVNYSGGSDATLCTGEVFGMGEGSAKYIEKQGKITCPYCIEIIKKFQSIKL